MFEFHEKYKDPVTGRNRKHVYLYDGKPMTGVTTILSVLAKPALIQWAANKAVDFLVERGTPYYGPGDDLKDHYIVNGEQLELARKAHVRIKDEAAEKGKDVHAEVEEYAKKAISDTDGHAFEANPGYSPLAQKFIEWAVSNEVIFLASEKKMHDPELFIAGTADILLEMNGKKYIADLKTSNGIYPEMFYQVAAYRLLLEKMGEPTDGSLIIRIDKKTGELETAERYDYTTDRDVFLAALIIYRANATYA